MPAYAAAMSLTGKRIRRSALPWMRRSRIAMSAMAGAWANSCPRR